MNSVQFKMNYETSTQTRQYTISDVADTAIVANTVRQKAKDFNTYLASSASSPVFVDSDGNAASKVSDVKVIVLTTTPIQGV